MLPLMPAAYFFTAVSSGTIPRPGWSGHLSEPLEGTRGVEARVDSRSKPVARPQANRAGPKDAARWSDAATPMSDSKEDRKSVV